MEPEYDGAAHVSKITIDARLSKERVSFGFLLGREDALRTKRFGMGYEEHGRFLYSVGDVFRWRT